MKKSLIITAHPSTHGFVHTIAQRYADTIKKHKARAEILDLYKPENQQPFLKFEDIHKWPTDKVSEMQQKISEATELVFVFPVWWGGAPAILKNWLDHNFTAGFAYKYTPNGVQKLLNGKTAKVLATSDAPGFAYDFPLSPMRITWKYLRLAFCGIKTTHFKVYGKMRKQDEKAREKILKDVENIAKR